MSLCRRPLPGWRCQRLEGHTTACYLRPSWWNLNGWLYAYTARRR